MRPRKERSEQTAKEYFLEQAAASFDELKRITQNAPHGKIFDHAETFAALKSRELIQQSLETTLQEQVDDFEKKETTLCPKRQTKKRHRGYRSNQRISTAGTITLERRYYECLPCNLPEHSADKIFGLTCCITSSFP